MATSPNQLAKSGKFGDLRRRIVFLLMALVVYRIGAHIPVPGIDPNQLQQLFKGQSGGILNLFNMFSGGALGNLSIFALGIMPYVSASIILQLLTMVLKPLDELRKEGELIGTRQSGVGQFEVARLPDDRDLLLRARACARAIMRADPKHVFLKGEIAKGNFGKITRVRG